MPPGPPVCRAVNSVLAETGRMMTKMPRQGRAGGED
ncbi:hypothetical protein RKD21_003910 [Streptomyces albogriseolus]|uniref:Uncharacterized protein n=1 Tax=Streptomyces albogriseolus TaxID=1887 RepID=A0ACC6UQK8_STRAO